MCHTWMEPTREGSNCTLSQENSGSSGSCAKAGRETPQPQLEQLPGVGRAPNVPWFGVAQVFPEGLKDPKKPQPCLGKGDGEIVGNGATLQGGVVEVGGDLESSDGIFPDSHLGWQQAQAALGLEVLFFFH